MGVKKPKQYKPSRLLIEAAAPPSKSILFNAQSRPIAVNRSSRVDGTLPVLPEYLRDFAFRYALEMRSYADWARIYHVAVATIGQWLRRPDVLKYVTTLRYERRLRLLEMTEQAETKALRKLNEILDQDVNAGNMSTMLNAIFKTLQMNRERKVPSDPAEANFNFTLNQYADNRQVNVDQRQLQVQMEELEAVERAMLKNNSEAPLIEEVLEEEGSSED